MKIKKGKIYKHNESGQFVHVKEITQYYGGDQAYIVCSDDCNFEADSKTSCGRQVIDANTFELRFAEPRDTLSDKRKINDASGSLKNYNGIYYYSESDVTHFIEELKKEFNKYRNEPISSIPNNMLDDWVFKTIDELAGKKLI